ncbi:actin-depolymerizing factor 5-like [Juglans regia]|uniref:Actin-depolymerizing factor 5-like n=1 Tax=Juglans regia TaxID=51240 RepID=A0A6P9EMN7_JUGRE|nr:actin-depolymerizing factor 5-like [Juglans regia]
MGVCETGLKVVNCWRRMLVADAGGSALVGDARDVYEPLQVNSAVLHGLILFGFPPRDSSSSASLHCHPLGSSTRKLRPTDENPSIRRELDGVHYGIQATDPMEIGLEVLRDRGH